jgi:hypothetical protein
MKRGILGGHSILTHSSFNDFFVFVKDNKCFPYFQTYLYEMK